MPGRSLNNDEEDRFGYVDVVDEQEEEEDDDEQEEEEELSFRTLPCWKLPQRNQVLKNAKSIITYTLMLTPPFMCTQESNENRKGDVHDLYYYRYRKSNKNRKGTIIIYRLHDFYNYPSVCSHVITTTICIFVKAWKKGREWRMSSKSLPVSSPVIIRLVAIYTRDIVFLRQLT